MTVSSDHAKLKAESQSAQITQAIGGKLGRMLLPGDVLCLQGELGSGKTCLTQGIARGLGVTLPVTSPTFIIVNEYALPGRHHRLYHIDLYRVESAADARTTGLEEYLFGHDICVVEWAERVREILPSERLWITLGHLGEARRELEFVASGSRYENLIQSLAAELEAREGLGRRKEVFTCC